MRLLALASVLQCLRVMNKTTAPEFQVQLSNNFEKGMYVTVHVKSWTILAHFKTRELCAADVAARNAPEAT